MATRKESKSDVVEINIDDLSGDDIEVIEEATGKLFGELFPDGNPSTRGVVALAWFGMRKTQPNLTFAQAMKMPLKRLGTITDGNARPTMPRERKNSRR